jgi:uncharacterized SAM-binding protein YcdF (DUF218 family)
MTSGRWFNRLRLVCLAALLIAGAWFGRSMWLPAVGRFLNNADAVGQTDIVMVLGGGLDTRPYVAAALLKAGKAKRVLIPSVRFTEHDREQEHMPQHDAMRRVLVSRGVNEDQIELLPGVCASTEDEAAALAKYLETHPEATVAVVTSDFHTRRTRLLIGRKLGSHADRVRFVAAPTDYFSADDWWQTERGWSTYTTEYAKLIMTWLR